MREGPHYIYHDFKWGKHRSSEDLLRGEHARLSAYEDNPRTIAVGWDSPIILKPLVGIRHSCQIIER